MRKQLSRAVMLKKMTIFMKQLRKYCRMIEHISNISDVRLAVTKIC